MATVVSAALPGTDGLTYVDRYNGAVNTVVDNGSRVESVLRTLFDLSNNAVIGTQTPISYGDFTDAVPTCPTGGCGFYVNDTSTSFGARLRGYLNITADLVGKPIHFGFYADDAVSLTIFDKDRNTYQVVTRPPQLGSATWRSTNAVTFAEQGLYPIEVLYVQIADYAALEMSMLIGDFVDYERSAGQVTTDNLKTAGFTLFPPDFFFQTLSGDPSFADVNQCQQCNRQDVNQHGTCPTGYYCNEAALCAPCNTNAACGAACAPCGGATPFCVNMNQQFQCAGCRDDNDCRSGFHCDPVLHVCNECNRDADCPRGKVCTANNTCVPCATSDSCAGNSCGCCPTGSNGQRMQCAPLDKDGLPVCVECTSDADCNGRRCDSITGHCVVQTATNSTPDCCGTGCVRCPSEAPYCLPTPVGTACAECRSDVDCPEGRFCVSGSCQPCIVDRRCGPRCLSCGGDTPFCLADRLAATAVCVRCLDDSHCGGGHCDPQTHTCDSGCGTACGGSTPYCNGGGCVQCYADTQCSCGGTCDPKTWQCQGSCRSNIDCLGDEHCRWNEDATTKACALGPMPSLDNPCGHDDAETTGTSTSALLVKTGALVCTSGAGCLSRVGGTPVRRDRADAAAFLALGLSALALVARRRRPEAR